MFHGRGNKGGGIGPSIFCRPKISKCLKTTDKSVYSNEANNRLIAKWILEITYIIVLETVLLCNVKVTNSKERQKTSAPRVRMIFFAPIPNTFLRPCVLFFKHHETKILTTCCTRCHQTS